MSAVLPEWHFRTLGAEVSPIRVPQAVGPRCWKCHDAGWTCSRLIGHGGRHAASLGTGEVVAVWA